VQKETAYEDDLQVGVEKTYFEDGKLASLIQYKAGKIDGEYKKWNEHGILVFEGEYRDGLRHGKINKYYDDGRPHLLQTFVEDKIHGIKRSYDLDGKLSESKYDSGENFARSFLEGSRLL
jgi:antitoxin component YwqK of YwqJK toxin-antitoxin module